MKRLRLLLVIATVLSFCSWGTVWAVEWNIFSSTNWSYMVFSQGGSNGFFGPYNADQSSAVPGTFKSANGWLGFQVGNLVSGDTASTGVSGTVFFLNAKVNPAIELHGAVQVNSGNWAYYPGAIVSTAAVQFTNLFVTVESPIGLISFGKKPFDFGTGLQYSSGNRSEEYLTNVADYGPFQIGFGLYPWRLGDKLDQVRSPYWNSADQNAFRKDVFGFVGYQNGPWDMGVGSIFAMFSQGPDSQRIRELRWMFPERQTKVSEGWIFAKYFNGRFFMNAEADWYYRWDQYKPSFYGTFNGTPQTTDGSGNIFRPISTESWRYAVQGGVVCGPTKLTLMYGNVPGPDRRGFDGTVSTVIHDRQAVIVDPDAKGLTSILWDPDRSNQAYFAPFSMILCDSYGAGVGALGRNGMGFMGDASVLATRLDYALASNLNMSAAFMYAKRQSKSGWAWGTLQPDQGTYTIQNNAGATDTAAPGFTGGVNYIVNRVFYAPNIPDDGLGWELNAGLDWELLQSFQLNAKVGYWQPGKWFSYACRDRSLANWDQGNTTINGVQTYGVNPNRTIDPIWAGSVNLTVGF